MVAKSARFLAPIALAAVAVGTYLIVQSGLATHHPSITHPAQLTTGRGGAGLHRHRPTPKFYIVKQGNTLSGISVKTHVSILSLTTLNPGLNPNSLQTGQRLRLRR